MPDINEVPSESTAVILARVEVKLDHALANVTDHESRIRVLEEHIDPNAQRVASDHEARIRVIEKRSIQFATVAAMIGAVGGSGLAQLFRSVGG